MIKEQLLNELAKTGFETMHEDKWDDLHPRSIERALWVTIVANILKVWRECYTKGEEVST